MTDRERWTVYPLLFLTLGIALRSKITSSLELRELGCHTLRCNQVLIGDGAGKTQAIVRATPQGGVLELLSATSAPLVVIGSTPQGGIIQTAAPDGSLQASIAPTSFGGLMQVASSSGTPQVVLKATESGGVLQSLSADGVVQVVLQSTPLGGGISTLDTHGAMQMNSGIGFEPRRRLFMPDLPKLFPRGPKKELSPATDDAPADQPPADATPQNPAPDDKDAEAHSAMPADGPGDAAAEDSSAQPAP